MLHRDLVENKRWLDEDEFSQALSFVSILPGPEAHQLATYIGRKHFGFIGGVLAGGLFLLPSLFIISGLTWLYLEYSTTTNIDDVLDGLRAGVLGLILYTTYRLSIKIKWDWKYIAIAMTFLILGSVFSIPIIALVFIALVISYLLARSVQSTPSDALTWKPTLKPLGIGFLIWLMSFFLVFQSEELRNIATLFTQAALITFGGAYSVVPFVSEAAVGQYGWLTQSQMLDGIALGETTPGPLIMINAFVGFIAFHGFIGALTATWFTFLPSFVLVFAGAPIMAAITKNHRMKSALAILNVVVITFIAGFAIQIFQDLNSDTRLTQVLFALISFVLLIKTKIPLIAQLFLITLLYVGMTILIN
jgi:chromate transporter